jgi:hypothetical protein
MSLSMVVKRRTWTTARGGGIMVRAEGPHAAELQARFRQHGIACGSHPDVSPGRDGLAFTREAEPARLGPQARVTTVIYSTG